MEIFDLPPTFSFIEPDESRTSTSWESDAAAAGRTTKEKATRVPSRVPISRRKAGPVVVTRARLDQCEAIAAGIVAAQAVRIWPSGRVNWSSTRTSASWSSVPTTPSQVRLDPGLVAERHQLGVGVGVDRHQHPAGALGEQRDERVDARRQLDADAEPPAERGLDQRLGQAAVGEVVGAGAADRAGWPRRARARPAAARGRGRPSAAGRRDDRGRPRPRPSRRARRGCRRAGTTASPAAAKPTGVRRVDVVDHAEHADHRGRQDRVRRRSGCRS